MPEEQTQWGTKGERCSISAINKKHKYGICRAGDRYVKENKPHSERQMFHVSLRGLFKKLPGGDGQ